MKNRETSDGNGTSWNASDGENAYYARVLAEVERLQPVGAGDGILVLNLMYPCFETGARIGMGLSVRSGKDVFPVGSWKVGRPYTNRHIHCPVRTAGRRVSRCGLPLVAPFGMLDGITGLIWTVTVDFRMLTVRIGLCVGASYSTGNFVSCFRRNDHMAV